MNIGASIAAFMVAGTFLSAATPQVHAFEGPAAPPDPVELYDGELVFDVLRNGDAVGRHIVRFSPEDDAVRVVHRFDIEISVLIFDYKYLYESTALWRDGLTASLVAHTNDDGEESHVEARLSDGEMVIEGPAGDLMHDTPLFPTNHWHAGVLDSTKVLNTITGEVNNVVIERVGREFVPTENGPVEATHYAYRGDLETEVWYDDRGRWVKMAFVSKDGSRIEHVCARCQGGALQGAKRP